MVGMILNLIRSLNCPPRLQELRMKLILDHSTEYLAALAGNLGSVFSNNSPSQYGGG